MPISLAFNHDGEAFDLPPEATGWRVKRLRSGKGAPELVYNADGIPLVLPIEADAEDLRDATGAPGKYRLDPVDEQHRVIKGADAAYVMLRAVPDAATTAEPGYASEGGPNSNAVVMSAMRHNSDLARTIVDRFPAMLEASAVLLRAADGAGLPARKPRLAELDDAADGEEADTDDADDAEAPRFDLVAFLMQQLAPLLAGALAKGDLKLPNLGEMLDWRRAAANANARRRTARTSASAPGAAAAPAATAAPAASAAGEPAATDARPAPAASADGAADDALPPLSPQALAHFAAIQAALTQEEAALARAAAAELPGAELRAWFDELSGLSVPEAVARVRALVAASLARGAR